MVTDPEILLAMGIQEEHDTKCYDFSCGCHHREWDGDIGTYLSETCRAMAKEAIALIEDVAVRRYRGVENG